MLVTLDPARAQKRGRDLVLQDCFVFLTEGWGLSRKGELRSLQFPGLGILPIT